MDTRALQALRAYGKAVIQLAILRHDLGAADDHDEFDIEAVMEDAVNAAEGIDSCGDDPIPELAELSKHFPTWIRIEGEGTLPERDDWYDIVLDDGRLGMGRFRDGNFDWLMFDNPRLEVDRKVTHWRNRPAPPSEGK